MKIDIHVFLITAFCFILVSGSSISTGMESKITADDLLIKDTYSLKSPEKLTKDQINRDVEILIYAFQNGYGGRKYVPREKFENALKSLTEVADKSSEPEETLNLCKRLGEIMYGIPDNHLTAVMNNEDCYEEHASSNERNQVGKNILNEKDKGWGIKFKKVMGNKIPVIAIQEMPSHEDKVWDGFLDLVKKFKGESKAIILDLRGNGGGSDHIVREMAKILYGGQYPYEIVVTKSKTPATIALSINSLKMKIINRKMKGEEIPDYFTTRLKMFAQEYELAKSGKIAEEEKGEEPPGKPFDPATGYAKPIYLVVDRGCASSCESAVEVFMPHPFAITVGENTRGFIHFGNLGAMVLPNSQLIITMATDYWSHKDGGFYERIGYAPKIKVPSGKDALEYALADLEQKWRLEKK